MEKGEKKEKINKKKKNRKKIRKALKISQNGKAKGVDKIPSKAQK